MPDFSGEFKRLFRQNVHREGADELMKWLESTDFFTAPASSRYHLAKPGGLVEHSINVYQWLLYLNEAKLTTMYSQEAIAIVALLHDVCKANFYEQGYRNQKTYDADKVAAAPARSVKHDDKGDFIWETVPSYTINEQFPFGHGEKSVYLVSKYMQLTDEEAQSIRYHMGPWQDGDKQSLSAVYSKSPLAFWLHVVDEAATFLSETQEDA